MASSPSSGSPSPSSSNSSDAMDGCWPWMRDVKSRIDNPIDPIDEFDKRPAVRDLIAKHREEIDHLKEKLHEDSPSLFSPPKHDDLWILRFLLSHGHGPKQRLKALEAAKETLTFRQEHHLDTCDIRTIEVKASALLQVPEQPNNFYSKYANSAGKILSCYDNEETVVYYIPDVQRGVVGFLQMAGRNQQKMVQTCTNQEYFEAHVLFTEWKFQWLDYLTRTTGRMTKYMSIADCHGVRKNMINKESKRRDGDAAKTLEDKYPQLLGSMLVCNAPVWINIVFVIVKPFLPKRLLQKVNLIKPLQKEKDLLVLREYCSLEHLPVRYGGNLQEWPPRWPFSS